MPTLIHFQQQVSSFPYEHQLDAYNKNKYTGVKGGGGGRERGGGGGKGRGRRGGKRERRRESERKGDEEGERRETYL